MVMASSRAHHLLLLFCYYFYYYYFSNIPPLCTSLSFSLDFSDVSMLRFQGDANVTSDGVIELTKWPYANNSSGRVWYAPGVPLWDQVTGETASFSTNFSFGMDNTFNDKRGTGHGLAFFLSDFPSELPTFDGQGGGYLGLFNKSTVNSTSGSNSMIAVEFDTFKNPWDPSDSHVGIDINSITSTVYTNVTSGLLLAGDIYGKIRYNSSTKVLDVNLTFESSSTTYLISAKVDLKSILRNPLMAIGFSAATDGNVEKNEIYYWSFDSTPLRSEDKAPSPSPLISPTQSSTPSGSSSTQSSSTNRVHRLVAGVAAGATILFLVCVVSALLLWHKLKKEKEMGLDEDDDEFESETGPRRFHYHQLARATRNFAMDRKLGQGGSGSVYKGFLKDLGRHVAIKRFSKSSSMQGKKAFKSEVKIISRLRHRNLVQLVGWCNSHEELLLVYELVPNGGLDAHLYSKERLLTWPERYVIVLGLGSVLFYLHREWEQCVVHGDIKPSNIMLDESFNAKLGDFGLARLIDHEAGQQTMTAMAGTRGYMDPECIYTGKTSAESDVYSFGIVLLEIACGRKPMMFQRGQDDVFNLVEWVWDLYGQKAILRAADERLNGDFDEWQMERVMVVGLWCAHPDRGERPSIEKAMNVLQSQEANLPGLPRMMPVPMFAIAIGDEHSSVASSIGPQSSTSVVTPR